MYIDPHLRAARLPARSAQPRFTARPLASSLVVHGTVAVALLLVARHASMPVVPEMPPVPMVFLPPAPAPSAPPQQEPTVTPETVVPPPPPSPREPEAVAPPEPPAQPTVEQPVPAPEVAPVRPSPPIKEARPARMRPERHPPARPRPAPMRPEPQATTAEPSPVVPAAPAAVPPVAIESGPVIPPRPLTEAAGNRPPYYPERAKRDGEQGRVILRVDVSAEGRAAAVAILRTSGFPDLDQSAAAAVRGWRFVPASRGGRAIPGTAEVPVSFTLAD